MSALEDFCLLVRQRTKQNRSAFASLDHVPQVRTTLLRIELDSMIRVIHVLSYSSAERETVVQRFYSRKKFENAVGKRITDAQMIELSMKFEGWTRYVYDFACSFVHLSPLHVYDLDCDLPLFSDDEMPRVKEYLHHYHGFDRACVISIRNLEPYLPRIFEKICDNTECYIEYIEEGFEPHKTL